MSEKIVELRHANIYQGDSLVLQDVNITVNKGEFVYLVGKTGTGKSSLLKTLYGDLHLPARVYCPAFAACAVVIVALSAGPRSIGKMSPWTRSIVARTVFAVFIVALVSWRGMVTLKENSNFIRAHNPGHQLHGQCSFIRQRNRDNTLRQLFNARRTSEIRRFDPALPAADHAA